MDTLAGYRHIIRGTLTELTRVPYAHGDIQLETVFDQESDRYLVVILGRESGRRIHGCLVHIEITGMNESEVQSCRTEQLKPFGKMEQSSGLPAFLRQKSVS